jgi:hypothetical protein
VDDLDVMDDASGTKVVPGPSCLADDRGPGN